MSNTQRLRFGLAAVGIMGTLLSSAASATPVVAITEWLYNTDEYIEITNMSSATIDFTNWSFDDVDNVPGMVSLTGVGMLAPGASALLVEDPSAAAFRARWGLDSAVAIVAANTNNLGRNDTINIYNNLGQLVDRLAYGDQDFPGTIRTEFASGNPTTLDLLDGNNSVGWVFSAPGDAFGSYSVVKNGVTVTGNPGKFLPPVPLPAALPLLLSGIAGLAVIRRRSRGLPA
jgi:predicted extracellular nuclease